MLEGLQTILEKEEIVATQRAEDLLNRPEIVDRVYQQHLRTYVPLGREAQGDGQGQSVTGFERRVINGVKEAAAVRGYITAEYGHGKTSTALYLWQRAREENILAVPPFQLNKLTDLLRATFGWVSYEVERTRPNSDALDRIRERYEQLIDRGAEALAKRYGMSIANARRMAEEKPDILEIRPADYIQFFDVSTEVALEAGYSGLLVIADELQQYIDPEIKSGIKDPVSPLFDVIGAVLTRRKQLNFGLILVLPPRELGTLRSERGDLIHRLLDAPLDLRTVYDQDFPRRLWQRLARTGRFEEHAGRIIDARALASLGQIAERTDLSDGPRTVINTLRRATRRYVERNEPEDDAYTPYHLVDDLLKGNIQYDSSKKIAQVTARVLGHGLVKGHPKRERAVMWAAAYPNEGVPLHIQEELGLHDAFDDLAKSAHGDLVISVGDVRQGGMTLRGLEEAPVESDWLSSRVRDFWRDYHETSDRVRKGALAGIRHLLLEKVFPGNQWTVVEEIPDRLTQNAGLVLRGSFTNFSRQFPERTVHVRLLWEDEEVRDEPQADVVVQFRLHRHLNLPESERKEKAEPLTVDLERRAIEIDLNLSRRDEMTTPSLERRIGPIVTPYKLTPLLLLNLYQVLEQDLRSSRIPQSDASAIEHLLQPDLLSDAFRQLFDDSVGAPMEAAEERIVENALQQLFEALYPDYDPLMVVSNWQSSLQKYENALSKLETSHERQGQIVVEGTKDEISALFTLSNTGLDSFMRNYPAFIKQADPFSGQQPGKVRFTLHSLEQSIKQWIQDAADTETVRRGGERHEIHYLPLNRVHRRAMSLGYLDKEVEAILSLMVTRGLVDREERRGLLREAITQAPSVDELEAEIDDWEKDVEKLLQSFPSSRPLASWQEEIARARQALKQLRERPDDAKLIMVRRGVQKYRKQLADWAADQHIRLQQEVSNVRTSLPHVNEQQRRRLQRTVTGSVDYAPQVNDLRTRLLKIETRLSSDVEQLEQRIKGTQSALQAKDLSYDALSRLAGELKQYSPVVRAIKERQTEFQEKFNQHAGWVELVEKGTQLSEEIQQHGELVRAQDEAFQNLSRDIRGHLSANKLDALPDAPTYSIDVNEISQEVYELKTKARQTFQALQDRYRNTLAKELGFPIDQLWDPYQYNPVAPQDTYERLREEVRRALQQTMVPRLRKSVSDMREETRTTLASPLLETLSAQQQNTLRSKGKALDQELAQLAKQLEGAEDCLKDTRAIEDFPEEENGAFRTLVGDLARIRDGVGGLYSQVSTLGETLRGLELTRSEDEVYQAAAANQGQLELSDLRELVAKRVTEDEFWSALRGLHGKRRIRVQVMSVRHD